MKKAVRMSTEIMNYTHDKELWAAIQQSDPQAFQQLYVTFSDIMYNYGCKISSSSDLVKDSIQDVFEILWTKRQKLQIKSSLKAYILQMFRRDLIEKLRYNHFSLTEGIEPGFNLSIESQIIQNESQQQLRKSLNQAIETLTPRQKEILFLRYYENLSYDEISELMSLNYNSMYKLLAAAIKRLKKQAKYLHLPVNILLSWILTSS